MSLICIIVLGGLVVQTSSREFLNSPSLVVENANQTGESMIKVCQMSQDNTMCSNDGWRCFHGECRDPGRLLVNLATGHCLLNSDLFSATGRPVMGPCPTSSSPMDRFVPLNVLGSTAHLGMPYYSKGHGKELIFKYKCLRYIKQDNTSRWYLTNTSYPLQFDDCSRINEIHMEENPEVEKVTENTITAFDWNFHSSIDYFPYLNKLIQPFPSWRKLVQVGNTISLEAVYSSVNYWKLADRWRWETPLPFSGMCGLDFDDDEENCIGTDINLKVDLEAVSEILEKLNVSLNMMDGAAMNPGIIVSWRSDSITNLTEIPSNCERQRMKPDENLTEYKCSLGYVLISEEIRRLPAPIASFTFGVWKFTEDDPIVKIVATTNVSNVTRGSPKPTIVSLPITKTISSSTNFVWANLSNAFDERILHSTITIGSDFSSGE